MTNSFREDPSGAWSVREVDENTVELSGAAFDNRKVRINFLETGPRGSLGPVSERLLSRSQRNNYPVAEEEGWEEIDETHGDDIAKHMIEAEKRHFGESPTLSPADSDSPTD